MPGPETQTEDMAAWDRQKAQGGTHVLQPQQQAIQQPAAQQPAAGQSRNKSMHITMIATYSVLGLMMLLGWFMAVGGVGKQNDLCGTSSTCTDTFGYMWWIIFYTLFEWIILIVCSLCNFMQNYKYVHLAFLAMGTAQLQYLATMNINASSLVGLTENCVESYFNGYDCSADGYTSAQASATGGFVLMSMANFVLMVIVGCDDDSMLAKWVALPVLAKYKRATPAAVPEVVRESKTVQQTPLAPIAGSDYDVESYGGELPPPGTQAPVPASGAI